MKKLILILALLFSSAAFAPMDAPMNYYVSPAGNDGNFGTQASPWRTILKCYNMASTGDTCNVQAGTYTQLLVLQKSGLTFIANGKVITKAIEVEGSNNVVRGFTITDPQSKAGIRTSGNFNLIENNEIHTMLEDGIWFFGHDNTFRGNYIHDILAVEQYPAYDEHVDCWMTWDWAWDTYNIVFENNTCDHDRAVGSNQIGILTGTRAHDITFRNNRFIMHDAGYSPLAFYGPGAGMRVENNYFCNTTGQGSGAVYGENANQIVVSGNTYIGYSTMTQGGGFVPSNNVRGLLPCQVQVGATQTPSTTPSKTSTATSSRTPTPTITPSATDVPPIIVPTATRTPTATVTPDAMVCVKVTWEKGLNMRPSDTMHSFPYAAQNFGLGAEFPVEKIFEDNEGTWMQVNPWIYSAMYLKSNNKTYAVIVPCK